MACRLTRAKPLCEATIIVCQLYPKGKIRLKFGLMKICLQMSSAKSRTIPVVLKEPMRYAYGRRIRIAIYSLMAKQKLQLLLRVEHIFPTNTFQSHDTPS